ncbi:MAG: DUF3187 family protein [Spirochaetales bacterium]|nr:DUF3187 family protein [Spirochaetales bacterium]
MKKIYTILIMTAVTASLYAALLTDDYAKGPLYGKNMYIPYLIYYNTPAMRAANNDNLSVSYHLSTYIVQDFITYPTTVNKDFVVGEDHLGSETCAIDYESYNSELGVSVSIKKCVEIGLDMRLISYCGGFIDAIIETFHGTFGFPNGGREYYHRNMLKINIQNKNGLRLYLDEANVSFGDIDFWVKWTFFKQKYVTLAALGAFKLPTGQLSKLSGSGYPDIATGILVDCTPCRWVSIYSQAAFVLPFDSMLPVEQTPYPMFNMIITLEVHPLKCFSILGQFSFKTPAISGINEGDNAYIHPRFAEYSNEAFFSYPQTNIMAGFIWRYKNLSWQFYFEEETFTWAGADITLNFMFKQRINIRG